MKKIQNQKNNNLITKTNNKLKNQLKKKPKLKIKLKTKSKSKNQELSHLIQKNISEEVSVTWKPSRVDSSLKSLKRRNSNLMPSETHSILEMKKANNKNNLKQSKKLNQNQLNQFLNNNKSKKSKRKRKITWLNLKKLWRNSVLKELKVKRRKRKLKRLKKLPNKLQPLRLPQSQLKKFNSHQLLKTLPLISTF